MAETKKGRDLLIVAFFVNKESPPYQNASSLAIADEQKGVVLKTAPFLKVS